MHVQVACPVCGDPWTYEVTNHQAAEWSEARYSAEQVTRNCGCQLTEWADSPEEDAAYDRLEEQAIKLARSLSVA